MYFNTEFSEDIKITMPVIIFACVLVVQHTTVRIMFLT